MSLTDKQEKFVQELIKGKSQREAYKLSYNTKKMTDKSIDELASRTFANIKVMSRYNEIHDRLVKEAEDETIITAKEILTELKHIAFDDIRNYLSFQGNKEGDIIVNLKNSETIDTRNISEISINKDGQFKFKLYQKDNALVQLGRHLGLFEKDNNVIGNKASDPLADLLQDLKPNKEEPECDI